MSHPYISKSLRIFALAILCTPAFAKDSNAMICGDPQALRRVGTKQDVETMMEVRLADNEGDQGQADPFAQATTYFRNAKGRQDYARALRLFRTAAESGDVEASFIVGFMFAEGYGTPRDSCEARYWYCTAGARGIEEAKHAMSAQCERFGLGAVSQ